MLAQQTIDTRISRFPADCKASGLKVTHQRTAVYNMMAATETHPSPEDVYSTISKNLPSISLATVYKILDLFHKKGFLRKVSTENQVARYDANVDDHYHMICNSCGNIMDLSAKKLNGALDIPKNGGFRVDHYDIVLYGECQSCQGS